MRIHTLKIIGLGLLPTLALGACSFLDKHDRRVEYKTSVSNAPLELPPDLQATMEEELLVPGGEATTYTDYNDRQQRSSKIGDKGTVAVLPLSDQVQVRRDGNTRWLVVDKSVEALWPKVRGFWLESGFLLKKDDAKLGILETEWTENRGDIPQDVIRRTLGKVADFLWSASTRDKFRVRLERGPEQARTEIYLTHRGAEQVSQGDSFVWQSRPTDPELEMEMLNRLMIYLGMSEEQAKTELADAKNTPARATLTANTLAIHEDFASAWRRTGSALDRSGFTVEDRDRSNGLYYVRFVPTESTDDSKGLLDALAFWRSTTPESQELQIKLAEQGSSETQLSVQNKEGQAAPETVTSEILKLLLEQLK